MKAAWIHTFPPAPAASGVFMYQLAEALTRRGTDVRLLFAGDQVRSWRLLYPTPATVAAAAACDLVHAQYGSGCGLFTSRLRGPKVLTLRGSDWYGGGPRSLRSHLRSALTRSMTRRSLRGFDLVITVSDRMAADVRRCLPGMFCATLPSGIDLDRFQPRPREAARRALGRGDDTAPWILFASALDGNPVKRPWLAAAAVDELRRRRPSATLITLTGRPHAEVPLWVAASDVLILTSTHEGWPNIVKEALACNLPFVATDVSDLAGIAATEESCHVAAADPAALASCLDRTLATPRSDGLRRHVLAFDLDHTAAALERLYAAVTAGRS